MKSTVVPFQKTSPLGISSTNSISILRAIFIWSLVAVFYFYDNLLQVSPSAMKPELSLAFTPEAEQFGSLSAYCLYAYGLMQIPAGMLLDRFGPKRIITLACALCAIGSIFFGVATTLWQAKLGRVFIGTGAAFALLCCLKVVSLWFPKNRYAFMTGLTVTVGFLGAAFGLAFVAKVVEFLGWREALYWGGGFGLVLCTVLWFVVQDKPKTLGSKHAAQNVEEKTGGKATECKQAKRFEAPYCSKNSHFLTAFKKILKSKQTWIAALFAGLMFAPTLALGGLWGIPFLVEAHGFDRNSAGICASLMYLGWAFGGAFWGFLSDYLGRRNLPMIVSNLATLGITLAIIYLDHLPIPVIKTLFFTLGFFSAGLLIAFAVVAENNPADRVATAMGFTNALNTLWGALAQPLIGFILDLNTNPAVENGIKSFTLAQYQQAFLTLPICLLIGFVFLLYLKETYCGRKVVTSTDSNVLQGSF